MLNLMAYAFIKIVVYCELVSYIVHKIYQEQSPVNTLFTPVWEMFASSYSV